MDCYIVRIYRHITRKNGQAEEIAGLVECVGKQNSGKSFSTYNGLIEALREGLQADPADEPEAENSSVAGARSIHSVRGARST